jgi:regulator of protease activity HflC (stomatin/prohibitin superfamily)
MINSNQPYINHGTIHILRIQKGKIGLAFHNNRPKFYKEGTHVINSNIFNFTKVVDLNQEVIRHGTITRFRVLKGTVGLAWEENEPVFFEEGVYSKNSPNFIFDKCVSASDKNITLGSKKIITVYDGEVGVSYYKGKLCVLKPDRHTIDSAEHVFQGFLNTQQQCLPLSKKIKGGHESRLDKDGHLICETKDFVEIGIKADVFYKIEDPEKVLFIVGQDNYESLIRETAVATINGIIRSTSLSEVAQNKEFHHHTNKDKSEDGPKPPPFYDKVHDQFLAKLKDSFYSEYGIEIRNIRIESFKIINAELADSISKQAFTTAQTETQISNLTGQTEIAITQQQRESDINRIKAEGESIRLKTETDMKNKLKMDNTRNESDSLLIKAEAEAKSLNIKAEMEYKNMLMKAEAEAKALLMKAEAETKAILMKAEAENKRAQLLSKNPLGGQLALFELYTDMVTNSMDGIEKVVYLPSDLTNFNPFNFVPLQNFGGNIGNMPKTNMPNNNK